MAEIAQAEAGEATLPLMYQLVLVEGGVVNSTVVSNVLQPGGVEVSQGVYLDAMGSLGECRFVGGRLSPYAPPPPAPAIPEEISDRQFFTQLAAPGVEIISRAEALAAVKTGEIPGKLNELLHHLPEAERFSAEMFLSGATIFRRSHPLANYIRQLMSWTSETLDQFWLEASRL